MQHSVQPNGKPRTAIFLLVGSDVVVRTTDIVAVLDQPALEAASTREFIGFCRRKGQVEDVTAGGPVKAAVVCRRRVLLSPFSGPTLRRRLTGSLL